MKKLVALLLSLFKKKATKKVIEIKKAAEPVLTVHAPVVVAEPAAKPKVKPKTTKARKVKTKEN